MQLSSPSVGIIGLGTSVPEQVMTNSDFEKIVETSDEWIVTRTGIRERRICKPEESTATLAAAAAKAALEDAALTIHDIDLIIVCSLTPDYICPSTACLVHDALDAPASCGAFDLSAACSGFIYGLSVGAGLIKSGMHRRVMVIGAEAMSKILDYQDRGTCILFGDGAGAAILGQVAEGHGLLGQVLGADGSGADHIVVPIPGHLEPLTPEWIAEGRHHLRMRGNEVYKFATRICGQAIEEALANTGNGTSMADLDLIVPHQANIRIIEAAAKKFNLPLDRFVINIDKYGNTSGATIPLALADARTDGRLKSGSLIAMVAFGGGLTYAASIWRW
jgi:3-oxoacyl-[acyl-carrier-protein] synthase-3